jgi:FG-GAP repeat
MRISGGRSAFVSLSDGGGALASGSSFGLRPWRAPALLAGAALACVVALVLATLLAPMAPSTRSAAARDRAHGQPAVGMALGLAAAASATIGATEHSFWPVRRGASLSSQGGGIQSAFSVSGVRLRLARGTVSVSLASVARGRQVERTASVLPSSVANRVTYRHGSVSELYRNGPYGLEQGFTVSKPPAPGAGALVLAMRVEGSLTPEQVGSQILFRTHAGVTALRYGELTALDATGRRLPARMEIRGSMIQLRIEDSGAHYPLRIDPFFQQGPKITGTETGAKTQFGLSVALSSDGNTALIGGPGDKSEVGAAWVFTRSGTTWEQQGKKLTGEKDETGKARFGYSVALSSNGNTALIGGGGDSGEVGAAWVFTRSGTTWEQEGAKLTGGAEEKGSAHFGFRVALAANGSTALVGGPQDNLSVGAAWVFTRNEEGAWTQQAKLTGGEETGNGEFGEGVALSGDGSTALIGGGSDNASVGGAWVFTRNEEGTWVPQGPKLTGASEVGQGHFGFAVALSEDGNTALIGGGGDNGEVGAAWAFTRAEAVWTQQAKLTGGEETGKAHFGRSVALSGEGNTALIGGLADNGEVGAAWAFTRAGTTWEQLRAKLTGSEESGKGLFGYGVALSGDGNTALVGGTDDNNEIGAAWAFVNVAPKSPTVVTGAATSITASSATLNATVNPNGETVTDCHFEYGTSTAYGTNVPCTSLPGSGGNPVAVSAPVTGLTHVVYHYRIVATNTLGTAEGADRRFTTEEAPEFGRCVKVAPVKEGTKLVYHGGFTATTCLLKSETKTGKYEWFPGVVKAGFTIALKEGAVTFETLKKVKTTCKTESGSGEFSTGQEVSNVVLRLTGCESGGAKCTTTGLLEGELETKKLEGKLGWEVKSTKKAALDLFPVGETGPFLEYTCSGGLPLTLVGSILTPVSVDKMATTSILKYKQASGKQKPEKFEGGAKDVLSATTNGEFFEQLGETATLTQTDEEAIEINAVV